MSSPSPPAAPAAPTHTPAAALRGSLAVLASALLFGLSGAAARAIGREALSPTVLGGLALAMAGSGLLILGGGAGLALSPIGLAAGVAAAVMMTWYTVLANQLTQRISPWALLTWGMGGAALAGFLFTPPWRVLPHLQAPELWPFFVYLGVLAAAVPFSLYIYGLRSLRPTPALILMTAEPVVGAVAAWGFLAEALRPLQVLGAAGIMGAVLLVQLSAARR